MLKEAIFHSRFYYFQGLVHCSPHSLYTELVLRLSATSQWSATSIGVEILQQVTDKCDVIHHISADAAGGLVKGR